MRKLATIRRIDEINPIENADAIEVATVGGWKIVVKKNEFKAGDLAVYFEIDSFIPHSLAPFLSKGQEPREFEGVKGERLKTIRLRGTYSQGLLLPITIPQLDYWDSETEQYLPNEDLYQEDEDVTEKLGILKYERPLSAQLRGQARGSFPSFIPKTDEERIQNSKKGLATWQEQGLQFEVTEKLDGSSMTVYITREQDEAGNEVPKFGVCSRNLDLKNTEGNSFWEAAKKYDLESKLVQLNTEGGIRIAIQGELVGEGIQSNKYKMTGRDFFVFRIYDIVTGNYLSTEEVAYWCALLGLKQVPLLTHMYLDGQDIESLLEFAEGKSVLNPKTEREGVVFKCYDQKAGQPHFKAISNRFLLKNSDD